MSGAADRGPRPARFLRQFALTSGRVRSLGRDLPLETLVLVTTAGAERAVGLPTEQAAILSLCRSPISIAEVSARLQVHLGVARVLVSDLAVRGFLATSAEDGDDGPDLATLERLLDDLQAF